MSEKAWSCEIFVRDSLHFIFILIFHIEFWLPRQFPNIFFLISADGLQTHTCGLVRPTM